MVRPKYYKLLATLLVTLVVALYTVAATPQNVLAQDCGGSYTDQTRSYGQCGVCATHGRYVWFLQRSCSDFCGCGLWHQVGDAECEAC